MRIILSSFFLLFCSISCFRQTVPVSKKAIDTTPLPEPLGWVSDFENVFTDTEIITLDSIINQYEKRTTNEIAVVTYLFDSTIVKSGDDLSIFSLKLFKKWGVGKKKYDNGIGILFSTNRRMIRIETGKGLTEKLTNQEAKFIIDSIIIPQFSKSEYFIGIKKGLEAIFRELE